MFEEPEKPAWEIAEEIKTYEDQYEVQKATTHFAGRDYVAWFTTDVPIQDGPYLFYGLPGLIVELYDTEKHYHFTMESMEKLDEPRLFSLPKKLDPVSKKEFQKILKKGYETAEKTRDFEMISSLSSMGLTINTYTYGDEEPTYSFENKAGEEVSNNEVIKLFKKQLKHENNWIELE